jgi:hypothetical protein
VPVSEPPEEYTLDSEPESEEISPQAGTITRADQGFSEQSTIQPNLITQAELNDPLRDLDLPKTKAQLLGSRLQQWNLPEKGVKLSLYRKKQAKIARLFSMNGNLVYCIKTSMC